MDKPSEAIEYYKAFETNKKDISSINEVGLILKQYEKYDEAMSYFDKAISIYPNYVSYGNRGNNKAAMGDFDGAIKDLKIALTHNDKSAECWNNIGSALNEKGLPSEALPYLNKAVELNPDYADAYNNLGIANEFLKNSEVNSKFQKCVEIDVLMMLVLFYHIIILRKGNTIYLKRDINLDYFRGNLDRQSL